MGLRVPPPPVYVEAERIVCAYCGRPKVDAVSECGSCGGYEVRHEETYRRPEPEWLEVTQLGDTERKFVRVP